VKEKMLISDQTENYGPKNQHDQEGSQSKISKRYRGNDTTGIQ
jgi:hypothetical protein